MGFFSWAVLVFLMKESKKRRQKQLGKLMAKSGSEPVNLPGARPLMNPLKVLHYHIPGWYKRLIYLNRKYQTCIFSKKSQVFGI